MFGGRKVRIGEETNARGDELRLDYGGKTAPKKLIPFSTNPDAFIEVDRQAIAILRPRRCPWIASETASVTIQCATAARRLPRNPRTSHWVAKTLGSDGHWSPNLTDWQLNSQGCAKIRMDMELVVNTDLSLSSVLEALGYLRLDNIWNTE